MSSKRIVIIGGVAGGMSAATRLRRLDEQAEIIVVERSGHVSFANCGLPYHVGGVIAQRDSLLLQTPASLGARFGLDVRVRQEAVAIDAAGRSVQVRNLATGEVYDLEYDALILSPGATPVRPPLPGIERALTLRNVEDTDAIIAACADATTAVVVGGGASPTGPEGVWADAVVIGAGPSGGLRPPACCGAPARPARISANASSRVARRARSSMSCC